MNEKYELEEIKKEVLDLETKSEIAIEKFESDLNRYAEAFKSDSPSEPIEIILMEHSLGQDIKKIKGLF